MGEARQTRHSQYGEKSALSLTSLPPYCPRKSQEALRQKGSETGFRAVTTRAQSGAHSKKPRVVRSFGRLRIAMSEFEGLGLAEKESATSEFAETSENAGERIFSLLFNRLTISSSADALGSTLAAAHSPRQSGGLIPLAKCSFMALTALQIQHT